MSLSVDQAHGPNYGARMVDDRQRVNSEIERVLSGLAAAKDRSDRLSEADTKAAFIDPILGALGWDLRDVFSVSREYRHQTQDNPVDYALFVSGSPVLFVEAKSLNKDLADYKWISQTIAYCNAAGVQWCVLTNGDDYRIYNAFAKAEADRKLFRAFRISDSGSRGLAIDTLCLLSSKTLAEKRIDILWKEQFIDQRVRNAVSRLFLDLDGRLVRLIAKVADELRVTDVRDSLRRCDLDLKYRTADVQEPQAGQPAPEQLEAAEAVADESGEHNGRVTVRSLIEAGVIKLPLEIEATLKGQRFVASVSIEGLIHMDEESYKSPSQAAGAACNKVKGPPPNGKKYWNRNGWTFWKYRDPQTGKLEPIERWVK